VKAIAAQDVRVARQEVECEDVSADRGGDADGPRDDVSMGASSGFLAGHDARANDLCSEVVIGREAMHLTITKHVETAVPYVRDESFATEQNEGHQRSPHATALGIACGVLEHLL